MSKKSIFGLSGDVPLQPVAADEISNQQTIKRHKERNRARKVTRTCALFFNVVVCKASILVYVCNLGRIMKSANISAMGHTAHREQLTLQRFALLSRLRGRGEETRK